VNSASTGLSNLFGFGFGGMSSKKARTSVSVTETGSRPESPIEKRRCSMRKRSTGSPQNNHKTICPGSEGGTTKISASEFVQLPARQRQFFLRENSAKPVTRHRHLILQRGQVGNELLRKASKSAASFLPQRAVTEPSHPNMMFEVFLTDGKMLFHVATKGDFTAAEKVSSRPSPSENCRPVGVHPEIGKARSAARSKRIEDSFCTSKSVVQHSLRRPEKRL